MSVFALAAEELFVMEETYLADKARLMPVPPQRLQHRLRDRLPAAPTLAAVPIRVTTHAPRVAVLLHERRAGIERIAALRAEEVARMPLRAARDDDLALDGRLTGLAARGEELVEVEMAVEAERGVAVVEFLLQELVLGHVELVVEGQALPAGVDPGEALPALSFGLRVEGNEFEIGVALMADEAVGVEALASGAQDATSDRQGAVGA